MRKLTLTFLLLFVFILNVFSQDTTKVNSNGFIVKTDMLMQSVYGVFYHTPSISLALEKSLKNRQSVQLSILGLFMNKNTFHYISIIPEYRKYLNRKINNKGLYVGGYLKIDNLKDNVREQSYYYNIINVYTGAIWGYQTKLTKRFCIDFLIGGGYGKFNDEKNPHYTFDIRANINLGYKF